MEDSSSCCRKTAKRHVHSKMFWNCRVDGTFVFWCEKVSSLEATTAARHCMPAKFSHRWAIMGKSCSVKRVKINWLICHWTAKPSFRPSPRRRTASAVFIPSVTQAPNCESHKNTKPNLFCSFCRSRIYYSSECHSLFVWCTVFRQKDSNQASFQNFGCSAASRWKTTFSHCHCKKTSNWSQFLWMQSSSCCSPKTWSNWRTFRNINDLLIKPIVFCTMTWKTVCKSSIWSWTKRIAKRIL